MPPRKSSRVSSLERPNYSDSIRRSSSIGSKRGCSNAVKPTTRTVNPGDPGGSGLGTTRSYSEVARVPLHQVEKCANVESQQHSEHHDLSEVVEIDSRNSEDSDRRGSGEDAMPPLGPLRGREEPSSEDLGRVHRQRAVPQTAARSESPTNPSRTIHRSNETPSAQTDERPLQQTSPSRGQSPQYATDVVVQPSLLSSCEGDERSQQREREAEPPTMSKAFYTTPSPFLTSHRFISDLVPKYDDTNVVRSSSVNVKPMPIVHPQPMPVTKNVVQVPSTTVDIVTSNSAVINENIVQSAKNLPHQRQITQTQHSVEIVSQHEKKDQMSLRTDNKFDKDRFLADLQKSAKNSKSIEQILRETEVKTPPLFNKEVPREIVDDKSSVSVEAEKSLNTKFRDLRLQTEKSITVLNKKWDLGLNILNDEMNIHFEEMRQSINESDRKRTFEETNKILSDHLDSMDDIMSNTIMVNKEIVEANSRHLAGLVKIIDDKMIEQSLTCSLIHRNVVRILSSIDKLTTKIETQTGEQSILQNIVPDATVANSNNPFAHEFDVIPKVTHPSERRYAEQEESIRLEEKTSMTKTSERSQMDLEILKLLRLCSGELEHAIQSRIKDRSNFEAFMNIFEEIVTTTSIGRITDKASNLRVTFSNSREGGGSFPREVNKDLRGSFTKDFRSKDPDSTKAMETEQKNAFRSPFRSRGDRQRYGKKPINAVNCEEDQLSYHDEMSEQGESIQKSINSETSDDGEDFCISNVDMFQRGDGVLQENDTDTESEEDVTHMTQEISLETLANNISKAESMANSIPITPFIARRKLPTSDIDTFLRISIRGFEEVMLIDTSKQISTIPKFILEQCWPTWETDMSTLPDLHTSDEKSEYGKIGSINLPIKLEHDTRPCFIHMNFVITEDEPSIFLRLGCQSLKELEMTIHMGRESSCRIWETNESFSFKLWTLDKYNSNRAREKSTQVMG
ncbi:uncharacterized protein MELLADRAFT_104682 [Melampsora larici-populina 98AG31]|uniref:Uncharacterized protein n=1 Tax=Melampsora larici-populina (strain 98AG31 / pathotype 3-4-7) TaxID=747676 RepID=F4RFJ8_MELLP|nr:uncharacterized protein MELLADRAFT_104682 [Melampsora larici-populina 98AG31]EGG08917.1 hypothetical protein MELLADRAFT_104682 [Melampsora larici-populina 98AG31]